MLVLWFVVLMVVLYTDFGVQPLSILHHHDGLRGGARLRAAGDAGQHLQRPVALDGARRSSRATGFRSGPHVGRVKGIAWRATTIVTRANERLEIPNSVIAKDVLFNYATGAVRDEIAVGISYSVPPNHVREVVLTLLRDVPQVLRDPPPEVLTWNYLRFRDPVPDQILDRGLRRAGTRARSRRVRPVVRAAAPFDRDSVPDPHRPCARRAPRRRRTADAALRARADGRPAPGRLAARPQRRRASLAGADCRGAPVRRGRDAGARRRAGRVDVHRAQRNGRSFRSYRRRRTRHLRELRRVAMSPARWR